MDLTTQINQDIKKAMLAKEKVKLAALRAIKAALLLEATKEGNSGEISEATGISIIQKLHKQRKDASKIYVEQNREDLAQEEEAQATVLEAYLPKQMSEEEITLVVIAIIEKVGAKGPSDMGKVMGSTMGQLKGKADGSLISKVVKAELNK